MTREPISPLGSSAESSASRRYARSEGYREQHDRLAPYRVIASAVILARGAKGLTQKDLGALIGTTDTAISRIESGRRAVSLETLSRLGSALGISFAVGSPTIASAMTGTRVVVVPEIAVERTALPTRPGRTSRPRGLGISGGAPSFAFAAKDRKG
jgi:transcriptional regulator with XRE-family HTH domain